MHQGDSSFPSDKGWRDLRGSQLRIEVQREPRRTKLILSHERTIISRLSSRTRQVVQCRSVISAFRRLRQEDQLP